jgi:hypothetical protein
MVNCPIALMIDTHYSRKYLPGILPSTLPADMSLFGLSGLQETQARVKSGSTVMREPAVRNG